MKPRRTELIPTWRTRGSDSSRSLLLMRLRRISRIELTTLRFADRHETPGSEEKRSKARLENELVPRTHRPWEPLAAAVLIPGGRVVATAISAHCPHIKTAEAD